MKKYPYIFILLVYSNIIIYSQSGWFQQNSGTNNDLYSVCFLDTMKGFAAGQNGTLIKTINGGIIWSSISPPFYSGRLNSVYFYSSLAGYIVCDGGKIFMSTDGGSSWSSRTTNISSNLYNLKFINAQTGFCAGASGTLIKSTDGGNNWVQVSSGQSFDFFSITFTNSQTGWIVGNSGKILNTINGGITWNVNTDIGSTCSFTSICFVSDQIGYASGIMSDINNNHLPFVYQTTNGGNWWYYQICGLHSMPHSILFTSPSKGWVTADSGKIVSTENGGLNWAGQVSNTGYDMYSSSFPGIRTGWIVGSHGTVLKTIHSGYYDTLRTNRCDLGVMPIVLNSTQTLDAKYRVMFRSPDTTYNIMRSLNGGVSYDTIYSHLPLTDTGKMFDGLFLKVSRIRMFESSSGNDSGNCGIVKDPSYPVSFNQTARYGWDYSPAQNCNLTGSKYIINGWNSNSMSITYPTTHTYINLKSLSVPEQLRNIKLVFTGFGNGQQAYCFYAASVFSYVYLLMKEVPFKLYECDPTDSTVNLRQLNCAFLEFPYDQGGHYDSLWDPTADSLGGKELLYIFGSNYSPNPDSFYTAKNLKFQQSSIDIWYVWSPKLISPGPIFHISDELYFYPYTVTRPDIVPGYPLYYEFSTSTLIGIKKISSEIPMKHSLSQNYPNPFNPNTKIKFEIPFIGGLNQGKGTPVSLKIFDILGRQITTLINEAIEPGKYEIEWDASKYSSGVYFYRLKSGDYEECRKMVLLK